MDNTEEKPTIQANSDKWLFFPVKTRETAKGIVQNSIGFDMPKEDEEWDELLKIEPFEFNYNLISYCDELKQFGIISTNKNTFLNEYIGKPLFKALNVELEFYKDQTAHPSKVKNHINETLKTFNEPIYGIILQILFLQGYISIISDLLVKDIDNRKTIKSLLNWLATIQHKKMLKFCCEPVNPDIEKFFEPITSYFCQTTVGKRVQQFIKEIFYDDTEEQQPTQHQQPTLPKELATDEAKEYLDKAIKGGFCNENYNWLKSKSLLAYFCDRVAEKINLSNGVYDNRNKVYWKPFEELFNVKNLTQRKKDYQRSGSLPNGHENIDAMFD